jgi:hypothetical protein
VYQGHLPVGSEEIALELPSARGAHVNRVACRLVDRVAKETARIFADQVVAGSADS